MKRHLSSLIIAWLIVAVFINHAYGAGALSLDAWSLVLLAYVVNETER